MDDWFGSDFFAAYYGDHTDSEAAAFIERLMPTLMLGAGFTALDACCGNGRHAAALVAVGGRVWGVDSSPTQIRKATSRGLSHARFACADIEDFRSTERFELVIPNTLAMTTTSSGLKWTPVVRYGPGCS